MECFLVGLRGVWGNYWFCGGRLILKVYLEGSFEIIGDVFWCLLMILCIVCVLFICV